MWVVNADKMLIKASFNAFGDIQMGNTCQNLLVIILMTKFSRILNIISKIQLLQNKLLQIIETRHYMICKTVYHFSYDTASLLVPFSVRKISSLPDADHKYANISKSSIYLVN